jgi:hypothetical protein
VLPKCLWSRAFHLTHPAGLRTVFVRALFVLPLFFRALALMTPLSTAPCGCSSVQVLAKETRDLVCKLGEAHPAMAPRQRLVAFLGLAWLGSCAGMIQSFHYRQETSSIFQLETFGFRPGGEMQLSFEHFSLHTSEPDKKAGFLMHLTESETTARQDIEEALERLEKDSNDCWLDHKGPKDRVIDMSDEATWSISVSAPARDVRRATEVILTHLQRQKIEHRVEEGEEGLYSLIFIRCRPSSGAVSFGMHAKFYNPGPDYLSAGDSPLPSLYFAFFFLYGAALAVWLSTLRVKRDHVSRWIGGEVGVRPGLALSGWGLGHRCTTSTT